MITALDNAFEESSTTFTENGNPCYDWICRNQNTNEQLVQFAFQSVVDPHMSYTMMHYRYQQLWNHCPCHQRDDLLKLFEFTRDIHHGKGLNQLSYYMLEVITYMTYEKKIVSLPIYHGILQRLFQEFYTIPIVEQKNTSCSPCSPYTHLPYGSWKDLKNFLTLFRNQPTLNVYEDKNAIIDEIINIHVIPQMIKDRKHKSIQEPISLCGKWLPRESCIQHGWLARKIAHLYHKKVFQVHEKKQVQYKKYRKLIRELNEYMETPQIYMCNNTWDKINFDHVTSKTMLKYKSAYLNEKNIEGKHRDICRRNFKNYISTKIQNGDYKKDNTISPHEFVKEFMKNPCKEQKELLTIQWNNMIQTISSHSLANKETFLQKALSCIDVSPSMCQSGKIPLYSSIGLGLVTMEISQLYRAFTFSETPAWIRVEKDTTLYDKIQEIRCAPWGSTTNIYALFEKFLYVALDNKMDKEEMREYTLLIYSDMQFDSCCKEGEINLIDAVQTLYAKHGYNDIPFLVFWNVRTTDQFPSIQTTPHCLKLGGNNSTLFQCMMNLSIEELRTLNSWTLIQRQLSSPRYDLIEFYDRK